MPHQHIHPKNGAIIYHLPTGDSSSALHGLYHHGKKKKKKSLFITSLQSFADFSKLGTTPHPSCVWSSDCIQCHYNWIYVSNLYKAHSAGAWVTLLIPSSCTRRKLQSFLHFPCTRSLSVSYLRSFWLAWQHGLAYAMPKPTSSVYKIILWTTSCTFYCKYL